MSQSQYDAKTAFVAGNSLAKPQNTAATLTGTYIDCANMQGPVHALVMNGAVAGTPDAQSATFSLLEADATDGTGSQAIPIQDDAAVFTANAQAAILRGRRTKRYVAVKCVLAFTNGTSPKQDCFGTVFGQRIHA